MSTTRVVSLSDLLQKKSPIKYLGNSNKLGKGKGKKLCSSKKSKLECNYDEKCNWDNERQKCFLKEGVARDIIGNFVITIQKKKQALKEIDEMKSNFKNLMNELKKRAIIQQRTTRKQRKKEEKSNRRYGKESRRRTHEMILREKEKEKMNKAINTTIIFNNLQQLENLTKKLNENENNKEKLEEIKKEINKLIDEVEKSLIKVSLLGYTISSGVFKTLRILLFGLRNFIAFVGPPTFKFFKNRITELITSIKEYIERRQEERMKRLRQSIYEDLGTHQDEITIPHQTRQSILPFGRRRITQSDYYNNTPHITDTVYSYSPEPYPEPYPEPSPEPLPKTSPKRRQRESKNIRDRIKEAASFTAHMKPRTTRNSRRVDPNISVIAEEGRNKRGQIFRYQPTGGRKTQKRRS